MSSNEITGRPIPLTISITLSNAATPPRSGTAPGRHAPRGDRQHLHANYRLTRRRGPPTAVSARQRAARRADRPVRDGDMPLPPPPTLSQQTRRGNSKQSRAGRLARC